MAPDKFNTPLKRGRGSLPAYPCARLAASHETCGYLGAPGKERLCSSADKHERCRL